MTRLANWKQRASAFKYQVMNRPCRSCGNIVHVMEEICPTCGAYGPYRVPYGTTLIIGLLSLACIVLLRCAT